MKLVFKKIFISSDHAGFNIKNFIINTLKKKKIPIKDLGPYNDSSVDYPDYAKLVSRQIRSKKTAGGILVCGSGTGMAISANKMTMGKKCLLLDRLPDTFGILLVFSRVRGSALGALQRVIQDLTNAAVVPYRKTKLT